MDEVISDDQSKEKLNFPFEYINSITPSGMPSDKLMLKYGAIVMLTKDINMSSGLVNDVRMLVLGTHEKCLKLVTITGVAKVNNIIFLQITKIISTYPHKTFHMIRIKIPIRIAFAVTINKAQEETFHNIGIYLPSPVFTHGQLYRESSNKRNQGTRKKQL